MLQILQEQLRWVTFLAVTLFTLNSFALELYQESIASNEDQVFQEAAEFVRELQIKRASEKAHGDERLLRGFHAKGHACLKAEFRVEPNLTQEYAVGPIFSEQKTFPAWVRFSNGNTFVQHDYNWDFRGLGIKVMDVPGEKVLENKKDASTQDFLMLSNPRMVAPDGPSFMEFVKASIDGPLSPKFAGYLIKNKNARRFVIHNLMRRIFSMRTERFWSGSAFRWGKKAMHYLVKPCSVLESDQDSSDPNYMRTDLVDNLKKGPVCYDFYVQLQLDPKKFPIEDASVEWDEEVSVPVKVAQLVIPQQDLNSKKVQREEAYCEQLAFNPWHSAQEYKPLGSINRIRNAVYQFSQNNRDAFSEPESGEVALATNEDRFLSGNEILQIADIQTARNIYDFQNRYANLHLNLPGVGPNSFVKMPADQVCLALADFYQDNFTRITMRDRTSENNPFVTGIVNESVGPVINPQLTKSWMVRHPLEVVELLDRFKNSSEVQSVFRGTDYQMIQYAASPRPQVVERSENQLSTQVQNEIQARVERQLLTYTVPALSCLQYGLALKIKETPSR